MGDLAPQGDGKGKSQDGSCVPDKENFQAILEQVRGLLERLLQIDNFERKTDVNKHIYLEEIYSTCGEFGVELEINT